MKAVVNTRYGSPDHYGASGAIGTAAVQLAKAYGAEVTAVTATRHLELVNSLLTLSVWLRPGSYIQV